MNAFTPLTPMAKSTTTGSTPPRTQTPTSGMLPPIPQAVYSKPAPALEKTAKEVPKAITAPPSASSAQLVGINAPVLEKVAKAPPKHSVVNASSLPPNLRPSWMNDTKPEVKVPALEVSVKPRTVTQPGVRVENPNSMYIITCDVHTMGCDSVTTGVTGRKLVHGLYSYAEAMTLEGANITEKLVTMVKRRMLDSFPPFLSAGISLGTAIAEVKYPVYDVTGDVVASIEIKSLEGDRRFRTIHIKRFRHNTFTSFEV